MDHLILDGFGHIQLTNELYIHSAKYSTKKLYIHSAIYSTKQLNKNLRLNLPAKSVVGEVSRFRALNVTHVCFPQGCKLERIF